MILFAFNFFFFGVFYIMQDLFHFLKSFEDYVLPYKKQENIASSVNIKLEHTLKVLEIAQKIKHELPENLHFSLELSALFHDVGRFEQLRIYNTLVDKLSCNHGQLGLKVLKKENFLKDLPIQIQKHVKTAVLLHNAFKLPESLPKEYALITHAVRDADKADILRVMVENFENPQENADTLQLNVKNEDNFNPKILENLLAGQAIAYADLKYVNDFRLLLGGWLNHFYFKSSINLVRDKGYYDVILSGLSDLPELNKGREYIKNLLK